MSQLYLSLLTIPDAAGYLVDSDEDYSDDVSASGRKEVRQVTVGGNGLKVDGNGLKNGIN